MSQVLSKQEIFDRIAALPLPEQEAALDLALEIYEPGASPKGLGAARPQNDDELKTFLSDTFGVRLPDTKVCPNHGTPFRAFADAYFARSPVAVWKASRGFGGKSYMLALLGLTEAVTLGADVNVLGGSGEQSENVHRYMNKWWNEPNAPRHMLASDPAQRVTRLAKGNEVRALMASSKSVRGPHPQRLRLDEADEVEVKILDAAMGQPMGGRGIAKQTVMSSTHQYPDGTMTEILKRAAERGWPVYEWCYHESSAADGWLSAEEIESKRGDVTDVMWRAEYDLQEPSPEDRAILTDKVEACFQKRLGEFRGYLGEYVEVEAPVRGATYATGVDWAKKRHFTIIDTLRTDVRPMRRVAWLRTGRLAWPMMIAKLDERVERYSGPACHDATGIGDVVDDYQNANAEPVILTGQARSDVFTQYIAAIEHDAIESPDIQYAKGEHKFVTNDDLSGSGHPPDSLVAGALAYRASTRKIIPEDEDAYSSGWREY